MRPCNCIIALCLAARAAAAAEPTFDHGPVFTVIEENDLVVKTDRHYTQGIKLSYFHGDDVLPLGSRWVNDHLPEIGGFKSVVGRLGYSVGQNIYTPANIQPSVLQREDRPYAGWLYLGAILQRRGWTFNDYLTVEDIELELGVIGPWAMADQAQTWVHELRGFPLPHGWKYQIKNEPGFRLKYSRSVRLFQWDNNGLGFDITPRAGASLGNVDTSLRAGATIRFGYNLPDDFGYHIIDSLATTSGGRSRSHPQRWSAYLFAGAEGRAVLFNETLDGALFHDTHSVQREWWVGDAQIGFTLALDWLELGYAQTYRSPEFRNQTEADSFGSVYFKARF